MMTRDAAGSVADQNMFADGRLQVGAQRDAGKRQIDHFATNLLSARACEMREAPGSRFDAVVTPDLILNQIHPEQERMRAGVSEIDGSDLIIRRLRAVNADAWCVTPA